jgi:hypothetical protein
MQHPLGVHKPEVIHQVTMMVQGLLHGACRERVSLSREANALEGLELPYLALFGIESYPLASEFSFLEFLIHR